MKKRLKKILLYLILCISYTIAIASCNTATSATSDTPKVTPVKNSISALPDAYDGIAKVLHDGCLDLPQSLCLRHANQHRQASHKSNGGNGARIYASANRSNHATCIITGRTATHIIVNIARSADYYIYALRHLII